MLTFVILYFIVAVKLLMLYIIYLFSILFASSVLYAVCIKWILKILLFLRNRKKAITQKHTLNYSKKNELAFVETPNFAHKGKPKTCSVIKLKDLGV